MAKHEHTSTDHVNGYFTERQSFLQHCADVKPGQEHCVYTGARHIEHDNSWNMEPSNQGHCRRLARIELFVGVFSACAMVTQFLTHYLASQITTIEKQFGLNSAQSGLLLGCNDIGFLLTTLFASYAARHVHIPRSIAFMVVLYGFGALICSTAFFATKDMFNKQQQLFTFSSIFKFNELNVSDNSSQWMLAGNSSINVSTNSYNGQMVLKSGTVSKHHVRLCRILTQGSENVSDVSLTCADEEDGAKQFGVGVTNKCTTLGLTLLAIGE